MINKHDPIKFLWKLYVDIYFDENKLLSAIPQKLAYEIIDKFIDAAYQQGVDDTVKKYEQVGWNLTNSQIPVSDMIKIAQEMVINFKENKKGFQINE